MLVSLRWLSDYVEINQNVHLLAERLTMIGAKVESIQPLGESLAHVKVGRISAVEPHPRSEELFICQVDVGEKTVRSVCGAPNTAVGLVVPVALPGAQLTTMESPVQAGEVRGEASEAILCSEAELGLSDDHSGLMVLPDDLEMGADLVDALGLDDQVIEFEVYPNRPDTLSIVGLAREVAALTGNDLKEPETKVVESKAPASEVASVEVHDPKLCPRYIARVIDKVKVAPSPQWMQQRLRAAGMRPINNVVDVTNFVMLELGQPLHAFDLDLLDERKVIVRRATEGEQIETLDGVKRSLTTEDLVICDASRPIAVAGVMGGKNTEVSDGTQSILLEAATFDPASVRKTARRLGMRTEASHRFEKGLHPRLAQLAIDRAAKLLADLAGGTVRGGRIDAAEPIPKPTTLSVRPQQVNKVLGTQISPAEMKRILTSLNFGVELDEAGALMRIEVPWYRSDVQQQCDIVEEVARMHGYDTIEATLPKGSSVQGGFAWPLDVVERVKDRLVAEGYSESITYSFVAPRTLDRLHMGTASGQEVIPLRNPLSEEQSVMRTTLMGSLLEALSLNERRQVRDVRLFELAKAYLPDSLPLDTLPQERWTLSLALSGQAPTSLWGSPARQVDFFDLKGTIEAVAEELNTSIEIRAARHDAFHPGRCAELIVDGEIAGVFGEVHPQVARSFQLKGRVYMAELDMERFFKRTAPPVRYRSLPRQPAIERDLALLVPVATPSSAVVEIILAEGGAQLRDVTLFDVYEGKQVPEGMRSLAYSLTFQADDRTLTDDEIAAIQDRIANTLHERLGVDVRK